MRKLIFALVFGALFIPDYGFTLGLGEIEVNSALNQQLDARIELLSAIPEDAETIIVKLASSDEFNRAGLDRPYILASLKFKAYAEDGQVYIKVTTPKPVREPFLNFLVEVDWPKGHLLREYTILLDPPVFMGQPEPSQVSSRPAMQDAVAPAPVAAPQPAPQSSGGFRPAAPAPSPVAAPAESRAQPSSAPPTVTQQRAYAPAPAPYAPSGGYRIQQGDTAWSLASRMRPNQSVSVQQMMLAMLRTNPEVFINGNVNGLKRGYILRMPDQATIDAVDPTEALATVRQHHALWREYQQALASGQPATAMGAESGEGVAYSSGIPSRDDARLEIVSAGEGASTAMSSKEPSEMTAEELRQQLALAREAIETERVEKEALKDEVGDLEQQVDKMKSLVSIEDESMAEIQDMGKPAEEELPADEGMATDEGTAEITTEEEALAALDELTGEVAPETETAVEDTVESEAEQVFVDELADQEMAEEPAPSVEPQPEPGQAELMPREEPGLVASLLNSPLFAGGVALLVLILLAVVYILIKRRRDAAAIEAEAVLAADTEADAGLEEVADMLEEEVVPRAHEDAAEEAPAAEVEEQAEPEEEFDSESTMILPSATDTVMTEAVSMPEEEEEERDDVIAEADVYLAYGIYQQAEELLNNAIAENPDKDAYRVKLAETYFASKNADGLSKLGAEMKQRLAGGESSAWNKVVALGKELCPENEIFQQAAAVPDLDLDELMPKSPEPMDFDLGEAEGGDTGEISAPDLDLDFDTGVDESDLETPALDETAVMSAEDALPETGEPEAGELGELEFDLSETEAVSEPSLEMPEEEAEPEAAAEDEFSLDLEAADLDLTEEPSFEEAAPAADAGDMEMEADIGELDLDMGEGEEEEASAALDEVSLDDLGADLDEMAPEIETPPVTEAEPVAEGEMDLSDLGDVDEINTKLDLARAYIDMGDHDGAKDILDEVVSDGNDQQKQEADELLKGIS